mgnify:CR=1 FL=1
MIAPLDWGLGHSTRCAALVRDWLPDNKVILAVTPVNRTYYSQMFPACEQVELPSYAISYSRFFPVWLKVLFQMPKTLRVIRKENKALEKIVHAKKVDVILSDNRFGCYHPRVHSVFMTHQVCILSPVFPKLATLINHWWIKKFNELWIPDYDNTSHSLAGHLSETKGLSLPIRFLGPLSALTGLPSEEGEAIHCQVLFLLSGPEPQRVILEDHIKRLKFDNGIQLCLVRGSGSGGWRKEGPWQITDTLTGPSLKRLIESASVVVCRSGYSTLMDLHLLNKGQWIFIPTPGQTEQEYLAEHWERLFGTHRLDQDKMETLPGLIHSLLRTH